MQNFSIFLHIFFCFLIVIYLLCLFISKFHFFSYLCNTECLFPFFNIAPFTLFFIIGIVTHKITLNHQKFHFQWLGMLFLFHPQRHFLSFLGVLFLIFHTQACSIRARFGVLLLSVLSSLHGLNQIVPYQPHNCLAFQLTVVFY